MSQSKAHVLFQLSGSIAAYKACQVISRLVQSGVEVQTVATPAALEFVGRATLEGLTGRPVQTETFQPGAYMHHIHLMKWADVVVLCPASANSINKLASGIGDDLLSTLFLSHDFNKPYLIAPAMNVRMYQHPTTKTSIEKLKAWGVEILETASGVLACGDVGEGKLLDPDLLLNEILAKLPSSLKAALRESGPSSASTSFVPSQKGGLRVLITAGGTQENIDGVRKLTNISSGRTGAIIAEYLVNQGHQVSCLVGQDAASWFQDAGARYQTYETFSDFHSLQSVLQETLKKPIDVVIHAAAVSDFSVARLLIDGKSQLPSSEIKISSKSSLQIEFKNNPKLLSQIKAWSANSDVKVIGFKLTKNASNAEAFERVRAASENVDYIVHNDLSQIDSRRHAFQIFDQKMAVIGEGESKFEMAAQLHTIMMKEAVL